MGSTYPNPPPAPRFTHTPETLKNDTQRLIDSSRKLDDTLAAEISPEDATFGNVIKPLSEDENYMSLEVAILGFYQYVSTDKALRDASSESEKELEDFGIESSMRQDIYKLVSAIASRNETNTSGLDPESLRLLEKMNKEYIRNGLALPEDKRERFKEIKKEKYPDLFPAMKYAVNPETRKKIFIGNENKCNENVAVFKKAIELRDEKCLGICQVLS